MGFNYGYEKKKFDSRWKRLEVEYCDAGMSEEQIAAMKEYDWAWFCSQRVFQNHTQPIPCEQYDEVCGQSQLFRKFASLSCIFRPSESKETVGVSPPSREKQVQVHGRESTGVLFWKEMAKERFAKRSSACHLFRLESFSFAHGVIPIDEDLVGTVLNPVQHSIC